MHGRDPVSVRLQEVGHEVCDFRKREFGCGVRVEHGRRSHLPVKEIAGLCGFDEPNYFAKVFRRFYGTSPTEFRTTGMYSVSLPAR
jgi:hypothetical protein